MLLRNRLAYGLVAVALLICLGWHSVLFRLPTDTMTGSANFRDGDYQLNYLAPPNSKWSDNGISTYKAILRVDARNVPDWLEQALSSQTSEAASWQPDQTHQYLVERRDGDGKRVINVTLQLPRTEDIWQVLGIAPLAALLTVAAALIIGLHQPRQPLATPLLLLATGTLLNLGWQTFGAPFSYIALGAPFWIQLALHGAASVFTIGSVVHIALTFPTPAPWYSDHRRVVLVGIYGLFPLGLLLIALLEPTLVNKLGDGLQWEQQATIALKAAAYGAWAAQYRRASVIQRGQLHWLLIPVTANDLLYLVQVFSGSPNLLPFQSGLSLLLPVGYVLAGLSGRSLRLALGSFSGFVHGIANTLTLALFLCGLGLAANLLSTAASSDLPIVTLALAVGFALTTVPLANLLRDQFDSWFSGTRGAQRALLHQFVGRVSDQISLSEVTLAFQEALNQGVQPSDAALWLWNDEAQALQQVSLQGTNGTALLPVSSTLYAQLMALRTFTRSNQFAVWNESQKYYGLIALISSHQLVGVCAIGARRDGQHYSNDALRFFETLTRSATLAFQNAQLVGQLEDKIVALRYAYQQLITVQESERQRLATELHDETLQQLAHANLLTGGLTSFVATNAALALKELQSSLVTTERGLREIVRGIHPAVLTDLGLIPALQSWLPHPADVRIELTTSGFEGKRLPDSTLELTLYRLCQESVNNALKHAHAKRILVTLNWIEDKVTLAVSDDGLGFEPTAILDTRQGVEDGHLGLLNLRERVTALNGHLKITSQPRHGTTIQAFLPIPAAFPQPVETP